MSAYECSIDSDSELVKSLGDLIRDDSFDLTVEMDVISRYWISEG